MEIKEMPIEEKYNKLMDMFSYSYLVDHALFKELGAEDKYLESYLEFQKKMMPSFFGGLFKVMKTISPGKAFKQATDQFVNMMQIMVPPSNIELTRVSDREATVRVKNCPYLKKMRDLIKKAGLDLDPRFMCEIDAKTSPKLSKEFGIDMTVELEEDGCRYTAKLK